jgi:hypothetical protein
MRFKRNISSTASDVGTNMQNRYIVINDILIRELKVITDDDRSIVASNGINEAI